MEHLFDILFCSIDLLFWVTVPIHLMSIGNYLVDFGRRLRIRYRVLTRRYLSLSHFPYVRYVLLHDDFTGCKTVTNRQRENHNHTINNATVAAAHKCLLYWIWIRSNSNQILIDFPLLQCQSCCEISIWFISDKVSPIFAFHFYDIQTHW